jgi:hypothetical protein
MGYEFFNPANVPNRAQLSTRSGAHFEVELKDPFRGSPGKHGVPQIERGGSFPSLTDLNLSRPRNLFDKCFEVHRSNEAGRME